MRHQGKRVQQPTPAKAKKKRLSVFTRLYFLYVLLLLALCLAVFLYVRSSLLLYENSLPEDFMDDLLEELAQGSGQAELVEQLCFPGDGNSSFENIQQLKQSLSDTLQTTQLSYSLDSKSYDSAAPVYEIYADGEPLLTIGLRTESSVTRMGILTISSWALDSAAPWTQGSTDFLQEDGSYACTIWASSSYQVLVNDISLTQEQQVGDPEPLEQFQYVSEYADVPQLLCYQVTGLTYPPTVKILDEQGQVVEAPVEDGIIKVQPVFAASEQGEAMAGQVDVLTITKTWSRFMTDDLGGARHGVAQVRQYLIPGSYLDNMANAYASGIDITFVSNHTLNGFAKETVSNCIQYSETCFSCDVYFEKNMTLTTTGAARTDVFNSRVYFVYITDETAAAPGWYMVDMQSILE